MGVEIRSKTQIKVVILILVILVGFFAIREYIRITGYVVYTPSNITFEEFENFEPSGVALKYQTYNQFGFDALRNQYFFAYNSPNISIVYWIEPDNTWATKTALFRTITVDVLYKNQNYNFQPNLGGLRIELSGTIFDDWNTGSTISRSILIKNLSDRGLYLEYNFSFQEDSALINVQYYIKGKTLIADISSPSRKITKLSFATTSGGIPKETLLPELSYVSQYRYAIKKGDLFIKIYVDPLLSNASSISSNSPSITSDEKTYWNYFVNYDENTEKVRQQFHEKVYTTISENFLDVYPHLNNPVSKFKGYLADKLILDFWGSGLPCTNYTRYSERLYRYGFENLITNFIGFCRNYETQLIPTLLDLNYFPIKYSNYFDCFPSDPTCFKPSWLVQSSDGSLVPSYYDSYSQQQGYAVRYDKQIERALPIETERASNKVKGVFVDIISASSPWRYTDYNGSIEPGANASYKFNYYWLIKQIETFRNIYNGPVLSEGTSPIYWIGYLDSIEGTQHCCSDDYRNVVIPDYYLMEMHPKMLMYGGYWRRFMPNADNNAKYKGITEADIDKYTTTHIAFGHIGFIDSTAPWMHNIHDRLVIRYYYLMKELQKEYALENATEIRYYVNGQWMDVSDAMRANYDFVNAQVRVTYTNGLVVYANRNDNANLNVDYEGKTYVVPPSGFMAYNPNDGFFEFSGLQDGKRVDISENGVYTYLDPRNNGEMNFTLHDNNYYLAQRFNIGVGLVNITYTFTILNKTIITTSEPLRLTRLPLKGTFLTITMNSTSGIPIETINLGEAKSILFDNSKYELKVDNNAYINETFNETKQVEVIKNSESIIKFNYDFSQGVLNLDNLDIQKESGYIIIKNINVNNKTLYFDKISNASKICIKDSEINTIADITPGCKGANEFLIDCPGNKDKYSCNIVDNKYEISGLTHSGAMEYNCSLPWICSAWTNCHNDTQTRTCACGCYYDSECTSDNSVQQSCTCSLPWNCTAWSSCNNGNQTRTCSCACGINSECYGNHTLGQNCTVEQPPVQQPSTPSSGGGGGGIYIPPSTTVNKTTNLSTNIPINKSKPAIAENKTAEYIVRPKNITTAKKIDYLIKDITPKKTTTEKGNTIFTSKFIENLAKITMDTATLSFIAALFLMTMAAFIMHRKARILHPMYYQETEQMQAYPQRIAHLKPREIYYKELHDYITRCRASGVEEHIFIKRLRDAGWKADVINEHMNK